MKKTFETTTPGALVERSVLINASPADVWRALVDPELATQWMGMRMTCRWEVGSTVTFTETPLGPDYSEHGTLLAFEPGRLLRYDHWSPLWRVPDALENHAVMTFQVEPDGEATRMSLVHRLPDVEAIAQHSDFFWRVGLGLLQKLFEP